MPPKAEDKFYIIIPTKELYNTLVNMLKTLEEKTEEAYTVSLKLNTDLICKW